MKKIIELSQFDSLASSSANKSAQVAAAASAAIRELAEAVLPDSDTIVITASTKEPEDKDSYWFYIEEVDD